MDDIEFHLQVYVLGTDEYQDFYVYAPVRWAEPYLRMMRAMRDGLAAQGIRAELTKVEKEERRTPL